MLTIGWWVEYLWPIYFAVVFGYVLVVVVGFALVMLAGAARGRDWGTGIFFLFPRWLRVGGSDWCGCVGHRYRFGHRVAADVSRWWVKFGRRGGLVQVSSTAVDLSVASTMVTDLTDGVMDTVPTIGAGVLAIAGVFLVAKLGIRFLRGQAK
jgi:hypothetical protein